MNLLENALTLAEQAKEHLVDPLDAYIELKLALSELTDAVESLAPLAIDQRLKYGKENLIRKGFLIEYSEGTPRYAYKHSEAWGKLSAELKSVEELMKQSAKLNKAIVDESTGEVFEPAKITYTKPFLRLTYQK
jgi:hypothetical protein